MISGFNGQYRDDDVARAVYSESAGIARITPKAVAVPADVADVQTLVRWAKRTHTPLIPRGSGSSMGNGAIGDGVIVDLSRLSHIGDVDRERRAITVGPGALRGDVDAVARQHGLHFPPDPSSGKFCTIGGMISTSAAGSHTLKYGPIRHWVDALDCVFDDGTLVTITRGTLWQTLCSNAAAIARLETAERTLHDLLANKQLGLSSITHPGVRKDSSGYALAAFRDSGELIDLITGSEGTLVLIVGATLRLAPVPAATSSLLGAFPTLESAVIAATHARDAGAAACELLDRTFLDVAARGAPLPHVPEGTEAVLLAEVEGDSANDAAQQAESLQQAFTNDGATSVTLAATVEAEDELWELRHAVSPILATLGASMTSMQFIEDGAVPPDRLPDYVRGIRGILDAHGVPGVIFGHAGDSHVHVNPLIDVGRENWRATVRAILDEVVALTASLGGTLTGEHGDGRLRTPLLSKVWSAAARTQFEVIKGAFDPDSIFNPGVKVPLPNQSALGEIKYDPALLPLPAPAAQALSRVAKERAYNCFRLDLIDHVDHPSPPS